MKTERSTTIDILRGLAMIMVMILHTQCEDYLGYGLKMLLFYVVPMYFAASGYLLSSSASKSRFPEYFMHRVKGTLLPYLFFAAFSLLWTETVYAYFLGVPLFGFAVDWAQTARAVLFAGKYLFDSPVLPSPLWFLHAMFLCSIAFYFIVRIKHKVILIIIAFLLLLSTVPLQSALADSPFWIICLFPVALFFMLCGYFCRLSSTWYTGFTQRLQQKTELLRKPPLLNSFTALLLLVLSLYIMQLGRGDMWSMTSDWYFLGSFLLIAACFLLARETKNSVLLFTGRNSLYYLGLHPLVLELPFIWGLPEYFIKRSFDRTAAVFLYLLVAFLTTSLFVFIVVKLRELIPSLIRKARAKRPDTLRL